MTTRQTSGLSGNSGSQPSAKQIGPELDELIGKPAHDLGIERISVVVQEHLPEILDAGTLEDPDGINGIALYGARLNRQCRELDYPILLTDGARFGVEVKGNSYRLDGTEWQLQTTEGWERQPNPLTQVWDASMQMRDCLGDRLEHKPFIIPIIHFPDMEPDRDIEGRAMRAGVHAIFGLGDFVERLIEIGQEAQVFYPPTRREIESEAEIVMPGVKPRCRTRKSRS